MLAEQRQTASTGRRWLWNVTQLRRTIQRSSNYANTQNSVILWLGSWLQETPAVRHVAPNRLNPIGASASPITSSCFAVFHLQKQPNRRKWSVRLCLNHLSRKSQIIRSWEFLRHALCSFLYRTRLFALLSGHAVDLLDAVGNAVHVDRGLLKPFLDPLSEFAGIDMLSSQSGSRRNLPLPLSCSSLRFAAWYSKSAQSPGCPTVVSKNSTKGWHNRFQMNDYMAAQRSVDAPTSVVWGFLILSSGGRQAGEDFPIGHQVVIIAGWTWAGASTGACAFIMSVREHGSATMYSSPH